MLGTGEETGVVFSIASVAAACVKERYPGDAPGPAEGTIRNPEGEPYGRLIAVFAQRNPAPKRPHAVDPSEAELSRAAPAVRRRVRQMERSVASLSAEIKVLKDELVRSTAATRDATTPVEPKLSATGLDGLRDWLSPTHLASHGWGGGGRLLDARRTTLMASAAYQALREMLALHAAGKSLASKLLSTPTVARS